MGLLDKLKPDYRHSNPEVRLKGINKLHDDAILLDLCLNDKDKEVKNFILPLLLYFSDKTSSVYNKQFKVKSKHNSKAYIDKFIDICVKAFL